MIKAYIIARIHPDNTIDYLESFRLDDYYGNSICDAYFFSSMEDAETHMEKYFSRGDYKYQIIPIYF